LVCNEAQLLLSRFGSYAEYSVSGSGIHVLTRGEVRGKSLDEPHLQYWNPKHSPRFFTVTAECVGKAFSQVRDIGRDGDFVFSMAAHISAKCNEELRSIDPELWEKVGVKKPGPNKKEPAARSSKVRQRHPEFSMGDYLKWAGLVLDNKHLDEALGLCFRTTSCPVKGAAHVNHNGTSTNLIETKDGGLAFNCHSSGCEGWSFRDVHAKLEEELGKYPGKLWADQKEEAYDLSPEGIEAAFPAMCDSEDVAPAQVIVAELLIRKGIHVWAGLFESYKTMFGIEMSSKLLGSLLVANHFALCPDTKDAEWGDEREAFLRGVEVLWLNLDMPHGLLKQYASPFGLAKNKRFRWNDPKNASDILGIDDPRIPLAVKGKVLFIDTMLDLANIRNAFESSEWVTFFKKLRRLITEHGCEAVVLIAHPTKASQKTNDIDPASYLKDSVTFGGKVDVAFAFRNVPKTGTVHVERIKGRGFKDREFSFSLAITDNEGNSHLDRGEFPVVVQPEAKVPFADKAAKKPGPPSEKSKYASKIREIIEQDKAARLRDLAAKERTPKEIYDEVNKDGKLGWETARKWIYEIKKELF